MWARHPHTVERFPSFAAHLPDVLDSIDDVTDPSGPPVQLPLAARPNQNRERATGTPAPGRTTLRRPRPSPLFGEGELEVQPSLRATVYMDDRPRTLWETEATDPGIDLGSVVDVDESVTLEVDERWKERIRVLDEKVAARRDTLEDDLDLDDLLFDDAPAPPHTPAPFGSSPVLFQSEPAPLAPPRVASSDGLAHRAPAPVITPAGWVDPETGAQVPAGPVDPLVRLKHAAEAAGWFAAGFGICGGTGAAFVLLVFGALFAG